jgi:protein-disulfide isomerase/peroxiredoxin
LSSILAAGAAAPDFALPAAGGSNEPFSLLAWRGKNVVLIFFPANCGVELGEQLGKYQATAPNFAEQNTAVVGISDATDQALQTLLTAQAIAFPLLIDSTPPHATAEKYGVFDLTTSTVLPTVFLIDGSGMIRRVHEGGAGDGMPNPAAVVRALVRLTNTLVPSPVTENDWQHGQSDARVTLIEYSDYECGPCGEMHRVLERVLPQYGERVRVVHRHLPLRHSHPLAQLAAEAAEAAGAQGKFWKMHHRLFEARGALEREQLIQYAQELGLDVGRFTKELDQHCFADLVNEDFQNAVQRGIKLPPSLFINGIPWEGARSDDAISAKLAGLLCDSSSR